MAYKACQMVRQFDIIYCGIEAHDVHQGDDYAWQSKFKTISNSTFDG
jgi:hypothetical protein